MTLISSETQLPIVLNYQYANKNSQNINYSNMNDQNTKDSPRVWQRMLSGRRLDVIKPSPKDIEITDIAHGLARVARWNGQTSGANAFSVAQHSLMVEQICRLLKPDLNSKWLLAALLHDGAEFVIGDLISPFKAVMGGNYKKIEDGLQVAIRLRFNLPVVLPTYVNELIKRSDKIAAYHEAINLAGFGIEEAKQVIGRPTGVNFESQLEFTPWSSVKAQKQFLNRFDQLKTHASKKPTD